MFARLASSQDARTDRGAAPLAPRPFATLPLSAPRLTLGPPDDRFEREADRIAEAVVAGGSAAPPSLLPESAPAVQRKCAGCEEEDELLQGKDASAPGPVASTVASAILASGGSGRPLSAGER